MSGVGLDTERASMYARGMTFVVGIAIFALVMMALAGYASVSRNA